MDNFNKHKRLFHGQRQPHATTKPTHAHLYTRMYAPSARGDGPTDAPTDAPTDGSARVSLTTLFDRLKRTVLYCMKIIV